MIIIYPDKLLLSDYFRWENRVNPINGKDSQSSEAVLSLQSTILFLMLEIAWDLLNGLTFVSENVMQQGWSVEYAGSNGCSNILYIRRFDEFEVVEVSQVRKKGKYTITSYHYDYEYITRILSKSRTSNNPKGPLEHCLMNQAAAATNVTPFHVFVGQTPQGLINNKWTPPMRKATLW